ncbi:YqcC family protein [Aestuariibacter sp. A3R04]|uniref:YqcC family protein n=1 Tax=Aestuariibacter sp. A3R04 TaxID=2841571 RepID=UPI001C097A8B|nr:YqcC family protein [Aestuariibacter sp. A3R04]MBU3022113.1 YqcC family protein [Aestuariibacter sp. A3R04]
MGNYVRVEGLLQRLENTLKKSELWSDKTPEEKALSSQQPFACDTLLFEQWLQFIFLPRMRTLVAENQPLPASMALLPMAEIHHGDNVALMRVLAELDKTVTKSTVK